MIYAALYGIAALVICYVYGADKQPDSKIPTKKMTRRRQAYEACDWLEWNEKHDGLLWQESKEFGGLAVRCFFYASGRRTAYSCHGGKGAMSITFEDYQARSFHAQHGGIWIRRIYDENERVKEIVDLMPTLELPTHGRASRERSGLDNSSFA